MRVMIGPVEISGIAAGLRNGFERIGVSADVLVGLPHPFQYGGEMRSAVPAIWIGLGRLVAATATRSRPVRMLALLPWKLWAVVVWIWALLRYDAFIFLFSQTITGTALEARLYRRLGKRVVMVYCGSDVRPPYIDGPSCNHFGLAGIDRLARIARQKKASVRRHEQAGFLCVSARVISQFQTKPYVDWWAMGIPRSSDDAAPEGDTDPSGNGVLRVLHSPSDPAAKGTQEIVSIIDKLKSEGQAIDLILLKGVPNEQVQRELKRCDFVVDQCWADAPMSGLAAEAAIHGKPAVLAGYAATLEAAQSPAAPAPVTTYVHPDELEMAVRRLARDAGLRRELGERARAFVRAHWDAEAVARKYLALLEGSIDPNILVQPGAPDYLHGYGMSEERTRTIVRALIDKCGAASLGLGDRPDQELAFVAFANGQTAEKSAA